MLSSVILSSSYKISFKASLCIDKTALPDSSVFFLKASSHSKAYRIFINLYTFSVEQAIDLA